MKFKTFLENEYRFLKVFLKSILIFLPILIFCLFILGANYYWGQEIPDYILILIQLTGWVIIPINALIILGIGSLVKK